jgi:CRISPR-associated protein Cmr2
VSTKHLLALSIGPVQDFIAAARRTGDLTAGSILLVAVATATAKAVETAGGKLIFPASSDDDSPNKILAELPAGLDPAGVAQKAKAAAEKKLWDTWTQVLHQIPDLLLNLADAQIKSFLEVYAAWAPFNEESPESYRTARKLVDGRLAARKNLRDFGPPPKSDEKVFGKSPLDPALACVLSRIEEDKGPLFLKKTETLDALSLLKRITGKEGQKPDGVPSTRDFAERRNRPQAFTLQEKGKAKEDETPPSYPYFAVLLADGDNMGRLLEKHDSPQAHRALSRSLAEFCEEARELVRQNHGFLVYAGGDDVLALLPAHTAVACAEAIRTAFIGKVDTTLSAGIALVHYKEPLAYALNRARAAEKRAKDAGRDRLCVALHTRGGSPLHLPLKWVSPEGDTSPLVWADLKTWTDAFDNNQLTRGVPYELETLAHEFKDLTVPPNLLLEEVKRIWERKESQGEKPAFPEAAGKDGETLHHFAVLLLIARFITMKTDVLTTEQAAE